VDLTKVEREQLLNVARRGKSSARKVKRSLILCKADEGLTDQQIADALLVGPSTVSRVRQRFAEEGLESALNERPRPGQKRKLDGKQEAHLVAIACSLAPEGRTHWTLQLLADKVVKLEFADSISPETVRQVLKKRTQTLAEERVVLTGGKRRLCGVYGRCAGPLRGTLRPQTSSRLFRRDFQAVGGREEDSHPAQARPT
tara:strand:- start:605 stop:1204 length:600 start_codon:yes stop_codon:yes gene_type:complete